MRVSTFKRVLKCQNTLSNFRLNVKTHYAISVTFTILGRSYKTITEEAKSISGFQFVWFTDGIGWNSARHNLEETFNVKTRAARKGRNPFTKEAMDIPEKNV